MVLRLLKLEQGILLCSAIMSTQSQTKPQRVRFAKTYCWKTRPSIRPSSTWPEKAMAARYSVICQLSGWQTRQQSCLLELRHNSRTATWRLRYKLTTQRKEPKEACRRIIMRFKASNSSCRTQQGKLRKHWNFSCSCSISARIALLRSQPLKVAQEWI